MGKKKKSFYPFRSVELDENAKNRSENEILETEGRSLEDLSRLAFGDMRFLLREELRPVRLQLELLRPELVQQDLGVESTIVIYGSARLKEPAEAKEHLQKAQANYDKDPDNDELKEKLRVAKKIMDNCHYYNDARKLARMLSKKYSDELRKVVVTGGGPGIMEAANRGAHDVGAKSMGLTITLPIEEKPNPYISPELTFHFHYFAIRKMHFLIRAKALVAFPGGFGTMDELFETLTLLQTKKIKKIPIILVGRQFWQKVLNFEGFVEEAMIDAKDIAIFKYVETPEEAFAYIESHYPQDDDL